MNILGKRYKRLGGHEVSVRIGKILYDEGQPLTLKQQCALSRGLGNSGICGDLDMPFQAYEWEKQTPDGKNMFWRLTAPLLVFSVYTFGFIAKCINWIMYGKWNFSEKHWLTKFFIGWYHKVFE